MKNSFKILMTGLMILAFGISITAQNLSPEKAAASALIKLFDFSKARNYDKAAGLIAYTGNDKARYMVSKFSAANKEELDQVRRVCKKISALLEISQKYEMGAFVLSEEGGKQIYTSDVIFISGEQKLHTTFKMIKIGFDFCLMDMN